MPRETGSSIRKMSKTSGSSTYLTRVEGLTLDGAARKLDENRDGLDHKRQIVEKLYAIRSQLSEIYESI